MSGAAPTRKPLALAAATTASPSAKSRRQRLLRVDVLARLDRGERDFGMRFGNGEIEHDVDVVAPEQRVHRPRLYRKTPRLALGGRRVDVGAGGESDVAKQRGVVEIDAGDVAAADEADLQAHDRAPAAKRRIAIRADARETGEFARIVVLGDHDLGARSDALGPKLRPRHDARSHVRPAILVSLVPRRRDVLDMNERDAAAIPFHPQSGVRPAARDPRQIGLPEHGVAEQMLDRKRPVGKREKFEVVIVPGEAQAFGGQPRGNPRQPGAQIDPAFRRGRPLRSRQIGRDHDLDAELARDFDRALRLGFDRRETDMGALGGEAMRVEPPPRVDGIVMERPEGLDIVEAIRAG